jgi:hypothetical protein
MAWDSPVMERQSSRACTEPASFCGAAWPPTSALSPNAAERGREARASDFSRVAWLS